jgi:hypothetical protein
MTTTTSMPSLINENKKKQIEKGLLLIKLTSTYPSTFQTNKRQEIRYILFAKTENNQTSNLKETNKATKT